MRRQPIPSEFPYIRGKFDFLFYQCTVEWRPNWNNSEKLPRTTNARIQCVLEFRSQGLGNGINPQGIPGIKKLSEKCAFFSHHRTYKPSQKRGSRGGNEFDVLGDSYWCQGKCVWFNSLTYNSVGNGTATKRSITQRLCHLT